MKIFPCGGRSNALLLSLGQESRESGPGILQHRQDMAVVPAAHVQADHSTTAANPKQLNIRSFK